MYLVSLPNLFGRDWTPYSVYSINRCRKLASGYTLDLGQLEIRSNDYFENWAYPESNPAFAPSANFQLAIPPVENTEFSPKTQIPFVQSPYQNRTELGRLGGTGQRVLRYILMNYAHKISSS